MAVRRARPATGRAVAGRPAHAGRRDRGRWDGDRIGPHATPAHRLLPRHRRLAYRARRVRRSHAPAWPSRRDHPQGHPSRRGQRAAPAAGGDRGPPGLRHRGPRSRRAGRTSPARHRRVTAVPRGAAGPDASPAVRLARRWRRRGGGGAGRHRDRRGNRAAAHATPTRRGRGPAGVARCPRTTRRTAPDLLRAPAGTPVEVRGRAPGRRPGDPRLARPRTHGRLGVLVHGRARLRGGAPAARRPARQGTRDAARRGPRGAPRHAGRHPPPARRARTVRRGAPRARPDVPGGARLAGTPAGRGARPRRAKRRFGRRHRRCRRVGRRVSRGPTRRPGRARGAARARAGGGSGGDVERSRLGALGPPRQGPGRDVAAGPGAPFRRRARPRP